VSNGLGGGTAKTHAPTLFKGDIFMVEHPLPLLEFADFLNVHFKEHVNYKMNPERQRQKEETHKESI
jgi:hypothetical protein